MPASATLRPSVSFLDPRNGRPATSALDLFQGFVPDHRKFLAFTVKQLNGSDLYKSDFESQAGPVQSSGGMPFRGSSGFAAEA